MGALVHKKTVCSIIYERNISKKKITENNLRNTGFIGVLSREKVSDSRVLHPVSSAV